MQISIMLMSPNIYTYSHSHKRVQMSKSMLIFCLFYSMKKESENFAAGVLFVLLLLLLFAQQNFQIFLSFRFQLINKDFPLQFYVFSAKANVIQRLVSQENGFKNS